MTHKPTFLVRGALLAPTSLLKTLSASFSLLPSCSLKVSPTITTGRVLARRQDWENLEHSWLKFKTTQLSKRCPTFYVSALQYFPSRQGSKPRPLLHWMKLLNISGFTNIQQFPLMTNLLYVECLLTVRQYQCHQSFCGP